MDVSPQTIRAVEFRERLRGYNQDDVDQFLERVAAGIEILQQRLRDANERAARAEQAKQVDGDDALRRTLALAQQTADLAIQEARDQAARLVERGEEQGRAIVAEAEEQARRLGREAQEKVERAHLALTEAARQLAETMPFLSSPPPVADAVPMAELDDGAQPADAPAGALPSSEQLRDIS